METMKAAEKYQKTKKYDISYETNKVAIPRKPIILSNELYENTFAVL